MRSKVVISVVIPVKNRYELLEKTLKSVTDQNIPKEIHLQVLVIDNLSDHDIPAEIKHKFPHVKFLEYRVEDSPSGTRNVGISKAHGNFIAFLDSDDIWKPDFINKTYSALKDTKNPGIICLPEPLYQLNTGTISDIKIKLFNFVKWFFIVFYYLFNKKELPKSAFYLSQLSHTLFRYTSKIKFDENIFNTEDWDFVIKMTRKGKLLILPEKLIFYRYHPKNTALSQKVKSIKNRCYSNLIKNLPKNHKIGIPYWFFRIYTSLFLIK